MRLEALIGTLEARVLREAGHLADEIESVYAGDTMSGLLEHAGSRTLLVTNLANAQLLRVAELMDLPAICLVEGVEPAETLALAAAEAGTALVVSPYSMFETCGRLYGAMRSPDGTRP